LKNQIFIACIILFFLLTIIILFSGSNYGINIYDEGVSLVGSERIAHGELPYKDFWTLYAPGQYFFLSTLLNIFGWNIFSERIISVTLAIIVIFFVFFISIEINKRWKTFIPLIITLAWFSCCPMYGRASLTAILLLILEIYFLKQFFKLFNIFWLMFAGLSAGLAVIFRHDFLICTFFPAIVLIIYSKYSYSISKSKSSGIAAISSILNSLCFCAAFLIATIPIILYFLSNVPFDILWQQLVITPLEIFPRYRSLPIPIPFIAHAWSGSTGNYFVQIWDSILFWIPFSIYIFSIYRLIKLKKENSQLYLQSSYIQWLLITIGFLLYAQASVRADEEHLMPTLIISSLLLPELSSIIIKQKNRIIVLSTIVIFLITIPYGRKIKVISETFSISKSAFFEIPKANKILALREWTVNYQKAIRYIQENTSKSEKIYCGSVRHDRILINDVMFYFLADRLPATYYHELHPGVATSADVQNKIIEELESGQVRYVVLVQEEETLEPNDSRLSSGIVKLDEYIETHYELEKNFGNYFILRRSETITEPQHHFLAYLEK
jgi:hypothetical protein